MALELSLVPVNSSSMALPSHVSWVKGEIASLQHSVKVTYEVKIKYNWSKVHLTNFSVIFTHKLTLVQIVTFILLPSSQIENGRWPCECHMATKG